MKRVGKSLLSLAVQEDQNQEDSSAEAIYTFPGYEGRDSFPLSLGL